MNPAESRVLDIIDDNHCNVCGTTILLLHGVGWVHRDVATCDRAVPGLYRCSVCRYLVFAFHATQRLRAHPAKVDGHAVAGSLCPGGLQIGIAPMADPWTQVDSERGA